MDTTKFDFKKMAGVNPAFASMLQQLMPGVEHMEGVKAVHLTKALEAMQLAVDPTHTCLYQAVQSEIMHYHFQLAMLHIATAEGALSKEAQKLEESILELEELAQDIDQDEKLLRALVERNNKFSTLH